MRRISVGLQDWKVSSGRWSVGCSKIARCPDIGGFFFPYYRAVLSHRVGEGGVEMAVEGWMDCAVLDDVFG